MLPIAISILFGVAAISGATVVWDSSMRGARAAAAMMRELRRMGDAVSPVSALHRTQRACRPAPPAAA